jgi:hypothetical protein
MSASAVLNSAVSSGPLVRWTESAVNCTRAKEILRDDLRPEPRVSVSAGEYSDFMWHICWCPECVAYERALEPPWAT